MAWRETARARGADPVKESLITKYRKVDSADEAEKPGADAVLGLDFDFRLAPKPA